MRSFGSGIGLSPFLCNGLDQVRMERLEERLEGRPLARGNADEGQGPMAPPERVEKPPEPQGVLPGDRIVTELVPVADQQRAVATTKRDDVHGDRSSRWPGDTEKGQPGLLMHD